MLLQMFSCFNGFLSCFGPQATDTKAKDITKVTKEKGKGEASIIQR